MSSAVAKVAKPVMRGLHVNQIKKNLIYATAFSMATSTAWYFLVNKARKDNYANFYKNYDAEADFQRMKAAGVFQSVQVIEEAGG
uniref:Cytochrome c oxidase subunit 6C-1-like isoform X1 n=1 Tax=Labidocera rotunda TaxID=207950 RepID=A0A0U2UTW3_9MAXI|nr:cytochrome c oxidase subunit 6C-1-like isoform X1 [Labidocera rotunda]